MAVLAWEAVVHVVERVHDALDEPWPVARLAEVAGYDVSHFSHAFTATVGVRPGRYVRWLRLERAAHQLDVDPSRSVLQVAVDAGFDSADGFARSFKRAFGVTPTALRRVGAPRRGPLERPAPLVVLDVVTRPMEGASLPSAPTPEALAAALAALAPTGVPPFEAGMLASPWGWFGGAPAFRAFVLGAAPARSPAWPLRVRARRWLRARWTGAPWGAQQGIFWLHEGGAAALGHQVGFAPTLTTFFQAAEQCGPVEVWLPLAGPRCAVS